MIPGSGEDYDQADFTAFVFGGTAAKEGQFPWMALLKLSGPDKSIQPICGGVLISRRSVATAGHCVSKG